MNDTTACSENARPNYPAMLGEPLLIGHIHEIIGQSVGWPYFCAQMIRLTCKVFYYELYAPYFGRGERENIWYIAVGGTDARTNSTVVYE